ncbi:Facilitated trehalose transporter Tret1 [Frankliniella fusca]|uniref:Facilitated trehalose transporter Tret1 n=1 Tax=Frankliniella fusca TaxID=407009 RepID=A0AAE1LUS4_9NEOP|nr:Facilitated trehalose transporter Tret1 [Frankliniella fusca]
MKSMTGSMVDVESLKALVGDAPLVAPLVAPLKASRSGSRAENLGSAHLLPETPWRPRRGSALRQVLMSFIANLGTINTGMAFGFSAVVIPQLKSATSDITIDEDQASWIASLSSASTPVGCILSGWLMDAIGRRRALLLTEIPLLLGWVLIATAAPVSGLYQIYAGRLLVGLGSGMVGAPARVYTGEVTQPHLRGTLSALASVGVSLGVLLEYSVGSCVPWRVLAGLSSIVPTLALLLTLIAPESPAWLVSRGRHQEARESLLRVRGANCDVQRELDDMRAFAERNNVAKLGWSDTFRELVKPAAVKPFLILVAYFGIYQFSGVNTITFYAVHVFTESGASMDKYLATTLLGVVRLLFTVAGCMALRRCGRRPLTLSSSIGCGVTMLGLGGYMLAWETWTEAGDGTTVRTATWFPVACIFLYTAFCTTGFLIVPWVMIGEVYPSNVRGLIGGLTTCAAHMFVFLVVKSFPLMESLMGHSGTFLLYGVISIFGTAFFWFFLPETKGRSLQEIEDYFSGRSDSLSKPTKKALGGSAAQQKILVPPKGQVLP